MAKDMPTRILNVLYNLGCAENPDKIDWYKASKIPLHELKYMPNFGAKSLKQLLLMIEQHENEGME
jgi:hypothetical protein